MNLRPVAQRRRSTDPPVRAMVAGQCGWMRKMASSPVLSAFKTSVGARQEVLASDPINNSVFDVGVMLAAGVIAYLLEENGFPIAPAILGVVLGGMLEENFITSRPQYAGLSAVRCGSALLSRPSSRNASDQDGGCDVL